MADYRAIRATCDAVINLLYANYQDYGTAYFDNTSLEFKVYLAKDFSYKMDAGVSLFLYRIYFNSSLRTPKGKRGPDGKLYNTQLPLDLHFILTAWAKTASLQHTISGWMMRTMEDNPIINANLLNAVAPNSFQEGENVEISLAELTTEDLLRLWEVTAQNEYQVSVPYVAQNVRIESTKLLEQGQPIQKRTFDITF